MPMPNGIHEMSPPISSRRRPVFVRPTCFCRSASQGDAPYPYPGYAGYAAGRVDRKKSLAWLRGEPDPACRTREGDAHPFDRVALERLASVLNRDEADKLRLPLTLIVSGDSEDSAYLTDELGAKALRAIEKFDRAFPFRDGRMALPHSLAVDLVRRHGGALQLAFA